MTCSKVKYHQVFKDSYTKQFQCIKPSRKGPKFAFCEICRCDFSIAHGGKYDVSRHAKSDKHVEYSKCAGSSGTLLEFFNKENQSAVTNAEMLFTSFLVEHNVSLNAAAHAGPLFRRMFPNDEIAKQYGCGKTKSAAIVNAVAAECTQNIVHELKNGPFSASCDGSNDTDYKLYPIVVRYFDHMERKIKCCLLSVPNLEKDATGENISHLILSEFEKFQIPLENCVAFMSDNAAVMQGKRKGVASFLKRKHENIALIGCACHLINLASEKGAAVLPYNIEEILVDIYYYLDKSSKRKETLKQFQQLHDVDARKILKHVCTRWLSLRRSLARLMEQWDPLCSYFKNCVTPKASTPISLSLYTIPRKDPQHNSVIDAKPKTAQSRRKNGCASNASMSMKKVIKSKIPRDEVKNDVCNSSSILTREEKLFMFLSSSESKAYYFLLNTLPIFDKYNTLLQCGTPYIHRLRQTYLDLLKEILCCFIKPSLLKTADIQSVKYHLKENQKDVSDVVVGCAASEEIAKVDEHKKSFYSNVVRYYVTSCDYIINKFPFNDATLKNAEVADLSKIEVSKFSCLKYFIDLFPCMLKVGGGTSTEAKSELEHLFCSLQAEDLSSIDTTIPMDQQWVVLADNFPKYQPLCNVMHGILVLPHSNADCERIFSLVRKNRTESRTLMSNKTLEGLLVIKTLNTKPCHEQVFSEDLLKKAKKATTAYVASANSRQ